ncbi:translation initiation factor IF-2, partial [Bacillus cereus]|nr:translation initiation factor IF-2 [Bacillus cereus]
VDIRLHRIIYKVIEEIEAAMQGMLDPEFEEKVIGQAEVRQTFKVTKVGTIAGCYVTDGKITRDSGVRIIRDGVVIFEGQLDTLKRFKDDVKEVAQNYECGITIERYNDLKEGDIIEAYIMEEVKR